MKKTVRLTSLLLSAILASMTFASGCGKKDQGAGATGTGTTTTTATDGVTSSPGTDTPDIPEGEDKGEWAVKDDIVFTEDNLDEYAVPEWYRDAKFGIFIHYGVYSIPAFGDEWYGHWMYTPGNSYGGSDIYTHHKNVYGGADKFGYKDFIPDFNAALKSGAESGMFETWAQLFSDAGARFVMPVGIHHDSFALYDSDIQKTYNSVNQAGIDYVAELQRAVKSKGMKFGISNHFAENDWFFDESYGKGTDLLDKTYSELYGTGGSKTESHVKKWYSISMEIIEKYHPDMIYYDFDLVNEAFDRYDDANRYLMLANYYNMAKTWDGCEGVVVANKNGAFKPTEAVNDKERTSIAAINPAPWQTDTSVGSKSWGYTTDEVYRSGDEFIGALIDIVSKNGNFLLNIGPRADGTIPDECRDALLTVGEWLGKYGDAIYATRPWITFGEGPTSGGGDSYKYTSRDIRFTRSKDGTKLYVSVLSAPTKDEVLVKTLASGKWDASTVEAVSLINGTDRIAVEWSQGEDGLTIKLPAERPDSACAFEITFKNGGRIPSVAVDAGSIVEVTNPSACSGTSTGSASEDGSDTVYNRKDGAFASYLLDFGGDEKSFLASVSGESEGKLTLRRGAPDGDVLLELEIKKGEDGSFRMIGGELSPLTGTETVCIVFEGQIEVNWFKFATGHAENTMIEAEDFDASFGSVQAESCSDVGGGENLGYVTEGDYVMYSSVDFGDGCKKLFMRLAGSGQACRVRLDAPDGKIIVETGAVNTGGWTTYKDFIYDIDVSGVHDVYITYDTGNSSLNVNWFAFSDGEWSPTGHIPVDDSDEKRAGVQFGAEFFDEKSGTVQAESCTDTDGGKNLGYVSAGNWVKYTGFDFGDGVSKVTARLAGYSGKVEFRLDAPNGETIATLTAATGGWSPYATFEAEIEGDVSGVHDLYIYFAEVANVNWFMFEE